MVAKFPHEWRSLKLWILLWTRSCYHTIYMYKFINTSHSNGLILMPKGHWVKAKIPSCMNGADVAALLTTIFSIVEQLFHSFFSGIITVECWATTTIRDTVHYPRFVIFAFAFGWITDILGANLHGTSGTQLLCKEKEKLKQLEAGKNHQ
jgi:hypothetical protein